MDEHHYLGALPKIGETLWYVAAVGDQWVALLSFSASALKCKARDHWIGWDSRHQYDRLKLLTNISRFLILPENDSVTPENKLLILLGLEKGQARQGELLAGRQGCPPRGGI